jgi:opacity protein-like surface antigen
MDEGCVEPVVNSGSRTRPGIGTTSTAPPHSSARSPQSVDQDRSVLEYPMKTKILLSSLALVAAGTAQAQDSSEKTFDGPKVGVSAGISRTSIDKPVAGETARLDDSNKSFDWRGYLGYDVQTDSNIVLGVELGMGGGGRTFDRKVGATSVRTNPGRTFDASARVGYALGNRALLLPSA